MVRAALAGRPQRRHRKVAKPFARYVPVASVMIAAYLGAVLPIAPWTGWLPDLGLLVLLAWRLLRADPWPAWWAAPMGFANDLLVGHPVGLSVFAWSLAMLAMDLIDRRTQGRNYVIEWLIAALFIALFEVMQWMAAQAQGAPVPLRFMAAPILFAVIAFPLASRLVGRLDRWRLGR